MSIIVAGYDIETTGLDYEKGHKIIEMAMIFYRVTSESVKRIGTWTQRVNPERPIDAKAQAVHGISLLDLKDEPKWVHVAPDLVKRLKIANLVVAHNGDSFDMPFTAFELMNSGFEVPDFETFDTMLEGRGSTALGKVPSLKEFCWSFGIEYDESKAHAALYDVQVMMAAFFEARRRWRISVPVLDLLKKAA